MKKDLLQLFTAFLVPVVASVAIIIGTCSCSTISETVDTESSARVEIGTRTVFGIVVFGVGFGIFIPSKTLTDLEESK